MIQRQLSYEPMAFDLQLPWVVDDEKEKKFRRSIIIALIIFLIFFIVVQFLPVFTIESDNPEVVTTTLILEPKKEEKPPEPKPRVKVKPKPKPIEPVRTVATVTKKKPAAVRKPKKPASVVTSQGLDDLSSQLASLTGAVNTQKLRKKNVTNSDRGKVSAASSEHIGASQITQRSSGLVVDDKAMKANVSALSNRQATEVEGLDLNGGIPGTSDKFGQLRAGTRDMESIRRSLEATKSRVYAIYQQKLLQQPDLSGKFIFNLIIEPNGQVSKLSLISSELGVSDLEREILNQIRKVHFGQDDVLSTTVDYTFYFTPT